MKTDMTICVVVHLLTHHSIGTLFSLHAMADKQSITHKQITHGLCIFFSLYGGL